MEPATMKSLISIKGNIDSKECLMPKSKRHKPKCKTAKGYGDVIDDIWASDLPEATKNILSELTQLHRCTLPTGRYP